MAAASGARSVLAAASLGRSRRGELSSRRLPLLVFAVAILASGHAESASLGIIGGKGGLLGTGLLSGGNSSPSVTVTVGAGGLPGTDGAAAAQAGDNGNANANVLIDLFGNGGDAGNAGLSLGVELGSGDVNAGASVGGSNVTLDLFGDGTDDSASGAANVPNAVASNLFGPADAPADPSARPCFTPNARQLAALVGRHSYDATTFAGWSGASTVKVIDAGVCDSAAARIGAQQNIGRLQTYITDDPQLRAQLAQWGHRPGDVIAIDRQGKTLIVYVS